MFRRRSGSFFGSFFRVFRTIFHIESTSVRGQFLSAPVARSTGVSLLHCTVLRYSEPLRMDYAALFLARKEGHVDISDIF